MTEKVLTKYKDELKPAKIEAERRPFREYLDLVREMNAAEVRLLAGSDLATSVFYPGFSLHDELQFLVEAGLTPSAAIATATRNPAALLGLTDLGTIATGKIANMVLLDQNPIAEIKNTTRINSVVYEGKLLNRAALDLLLKTGAEMAARR